MKLGNRGTHIFLLITFIVSLSSTYGQNELKRFSVGGSGGIGIPVAPSLFQDYYRWNLNTGIDFTFFFSQMTGLHLEMIYQPVYFKDRQTKEELEGIFGELYSVDEIRGGSMWLSLISMHLLQYLQSPNHSPRFYVFLGGGLSIRKTADIEISGSILDYQFNRTDTLRSETTFGLSGGVGFTTACSDNIHLFVEGQYHHICSDQTDFWNPEIFTVENSERPFSFILFITGMRFGI